MTVVPTARRPRFMSLDVFRGMTVFLMILVNTAGPGAAPFSTLVHAKWIGFTLADLVYPSFLFAVGNAMSFAPDGVSARPFLSRVARRSVLIFLLGFLMYWYPFVTHGADGWAWKPLAETRIPGVLQRIALCYFLGAIACRWLGPRGLAALAVALLLGYWAILVLGSAPGMAFDAHVNVGTRLDLSLFGPQHLYKKDHGFDPEGLLGTIPATATLIAGFLAGRHLRARGHSRRSVATMIVAGVMIALIGCAWAPWFPIAKKLWTGSYALLTAGIDLVVLGLLVEAIERRGWRVGTRFFEILGRNPLAIYLFSELFVATLALITVAPGVDLYQWIGILLFQCVWPGAMGSLLCALTYTLVCWAVGWWLNRKGWLLKV